MSGRSDHITFPIVKHPITYRVSEEMAAVSLGFSRLGHYEPVEVTDEQKAAHARALELVEEVEDNPYVHLDGYDADLRVDDLVTERWVPDETDEEWLRRFREWRAANPDAQSKLPWPQSMLADVFAAAFDTSIVMTSLRQEER